MAWFGVRHVLQNDTNFEERVTVWQASSFEEAMSLARQEAKEYADGALYDGHVLGLFQAYELFEPPGHGAEVFSLIRASQLAPDDYVRHFYDTGEELVVDMP